MSTLFGLLDLGSNAIHAQNQGIATASNNAANVHTEGYSRQRIEHRSELASPVVGGVRVTGPFRISSDLLSGRHRVASGSLGFATAFHEALMDLETALGASQEDVSASVGAFFSEMSSLSASPLDGSLREAAVVASRKLAVSIRRHASHIEQAQSAADARLRDQSSTASQLAADIARANEAIAISDDPVLRDRRDLAAAQLAELVGGNARIDPDGAMRITLGNGAVVVDGHRSVTFEAIPDAALNNMHRIELVDGSHRQDVTEGIDGGKLGADLRFRDTESVAMASQLDQFSFDLATQLNAVHRGFAGADGTGGRNLFVEPTSITGAAAGFALDSVVDGDPEQLAVAAIGGGAGDNSGVLALLATRDQSLAGGGTRTFLDESIHMMTGLGHEVRRAAGDEDFYRLQKSNIEGLVDALSGVSLDEELTKLSQFQHATEAAARFVSTVDGLLGTLIQSL